MATQTLNFQMYNSHICHWQLQMCSISEILLQLPEDRRSEKRRAKNSQSFTENGVDGSEKSAAGLQAAGPHHI